MTSRGSILEMAQLLPGGGIWTGVRGYREAQGVTSQADWGRVRQGAEAGWALLQEVCGTGPQPHMGVARPFLEAQGPALQHWHEDPAVTLPCPWGQHAQCGLLSLGAPLCWPLLLWLFDGPLACASQSWAKSKRLCACQPSTRHVYPCVWSELSSPFLFSMDSVKSDLHLALVYAIGQRVWLGDSELEYACPDV